MPLFATINPKRHLGGVSALSLCLLLSACASMSTQECLTANWQEQGYRDGRMGYPMTRLEDHREACFKVGVTPNTTQYQQGRATGIQEYCTPANAIYEGRHGRSYRNACPMALERTFLSYYERGYWVYQTEQRLNSLNREAEQIQRQLNKEKEESKRQALRRELRRLDQQLQHTRQQLNEEDRRLRLSLPPLK